MRYLPRTCKTPRHITCVSFRDTMDLVQKFEGVIWDKTVSVNDLERSRKYPILRAKRITARIGPTVVLTIRDSRDPPAEVFLPKRYSDVVTDDDIEKITTNAVSLNLL